MLFQLHMDTIVAFYIKQKFEKKEKEQHAFSGMIAKKTQLGIEITRFAEFILST